MEDSSRHASIESQRVLERINIFKPRVIGERSLKRENKISRTVIPSGCTKTNSNKVTENAVVTKETSNKRPSTSPMKRWQLVCIKQTAINEEAMFTFGQPNYCRLFNSSIHWWWEKLSQRPVLYTRYFYRLASFITTSQWQRLIELFTRGGNQRERERKNYDRGNEIITVGNQPKKKSKGYQRQGNERVELALGYKPKEEKLLMLQPTAGTSPAS